MLLLKSQVIAFQDASLGPRDVKTVAAVCRKTVEDVQNTLKINVIQNKF